MNDMKWFLIGCKGYRAADWDLNHCRVVSFHVVTNTTSLRCPEESLYINDKIEPALSETAGMTVQEIRETLSASAR